MAPNGLDLDAPLETERISEFIRRTVAGAGAEGAVVGLSGGIDSAVVGALCVRALGKGRVFGLLLPSDHTPKEDMNDAQSLVKSWGIRSAIVRISPILDSLLSVLGNEKVRMPYANLQARIRMSILYFYANKMNYLVAGTGDRSENLLGYFCYDEKTRVVTKQGPKGIGELKTDDVVFSFDPTTKKVKESKVDGVFVFDYNGEMVNFRSRNADIMVTPNHRMLVVSSSTGDYQYAKPVFRSAQECLRRKYTVVPIPAGWDGVGDLPAEFQVTFSQKHVVRAISVRMEDLLFVFGLFIGDGCAVKGTTVVPARSGLTRGEYQAQVRDTKGRFLALSPQVSRPRMRAYDTYETDFALPNYTKDDARQRLIRILEKYEISYSLTRDLVRIPSKGLFDLFSQCGFGARQKHIPPWILEYPSNYLTFLLHGLRASDGSKGKGEVYCTSSSRLKDDFVQLCVKIGRMPKVRTRAPRTSRLKSGKIIRSSESYEIIYARKVKRGRTIRNSNAKKVHYEGKVWCPSVPPFENMLVERNGNYVFCGNTKFGDGGADFLPIVHLYKTQTRQLGAHLGLPRRVVDKPASPQLWPGQRASDELPAEYDRLDVALHRLFDLKTGVDEAAADAGLPRSAVRKALEMHRKSAHKRALPPSLG
ncbi:MAG: NAD(+) synthase [Nitrososphaerota archaeon]|nr:NAD(+) synthase [Nitrososphaerota archaeon]MDG6969588.1 NAD(+) synthase [Nitrososphaerota archaeon]